MSNLEIIAITTVIISTIIFIAVTLLIIVGIYDKERKVKEKWKRY